MLSTGCSYSTHWVNPLRANHCHTWHMENHPFLWRRIRRVRRIQVCMARKGLIKTLNWPLSTGDVINCVFDECPDNSVWTGSMAKQLLSLLLCHTTICKCKHIHTHVNFYWPVSDLTVAMTSINFDQLLIKQPFGRFSKFNLKINGSLGEIQVKTFFLAFTDDEGVPRNVCSLHWTLTTVPVISLIKTVSSCVVQIVCVITNQGSSNPNCLNFLKDAYKVYQGVPPTYWKHSVAKISHQGCLVALVFCTKLYIKLVVSLSLFSQFSFPFNFRTALVLKFGTLPLKCF